MKKTKPLKTSRIQRTITRVVFAGFIIYGITLVISFFWIAREIEGTKHWLATEGTVISTTVETSMGYSEHRGNTIRYSPSVKYTYSVDGKTQNGDHVTFSNRSTRIQSTAEAVISKYPVGSTITVFYNPEAHHQSVLEPGGGSPAQNYYLAFLGSLIFIFGIGGLYAHREKLGFQKIRKYLT